MRQLVESTGSISSKLAVIREKADNITQVVTTITRVADQTNLLSINAASEAEEAGDRGRDSVVVAREARLLADQTAVATLDIESMVRLMQDAVSAGVMQTDQFGEAVRSGVGRVAGVNSQTGGMTSPKAPTTAPPARRPAATPPARRPCCSPAPPASPPPSSSWVRPMPAVRDARALSQRRL
jgi:hypothetical protein